MIKIPPFLEEMVELGIRPTIEKHSVYGICYNLNTMMKSHMILYEHDGQWFVEMRYGEVFAVSSIEDIGYYGHRAKWGRDYMSSDWFNLLEKY
jgi:hypothetical protein